MKEIIRISRRFLPNLLYWEILIGLLGGLICGMLVAKHGYAWWMIPAHICFLIGCLLILKDIKNRWKIVGNWLVWAFLIGLGTIYSYAIYSNHLWGRYISWQMIGISWTEPAALWEGIELSASWVRWMLLLILLMTALQLSLCLRVQFYGF